MTNELVQVDGWHATNTSLDIPKGVPFAEIEEQVNYLHARRESWHWYMGALINYAKEYYPDKVSQLYRASDKSQQVLSKASVVERQVRPTTRVVDNKKKGEGRWTT